MKWMRAFFTTLADALFQLLVIFLVCVAAAQEETREAQTVAEQVPGLLTELDVVREGWRTEQMTVGELAGENGRLKHSLDLARTELTTQSGVLSDQEKELRTILDAFGWLKQEQATKEEALQMARSENDAQSKVIHKQQRDVEQAHRLNADLKEAFHSLERDYHVLQGKLKSGPPVTLVVMSDGTASMTEALAMTRESLATLFEVMPNTSRDFRVGVLAFRRGVVARFPITQILPAYEDGGASQRAALEFLDSLQVEDSITDHLPVFEEAIRMMAAAHPEPDPERKERIILIGDVGVSEFDGQQGYSEPERERKDHILRLLRDWANERDRAVEALYAENAWVIKNDPARVENKAWFEDLGRISPQSACYTESSAILRALLHASLPHD